MFYLLSQIIYGVIRAAIWIVFRVVDTVIDLFFDPVRTLVRIIRDLSVLAMLVLIGGAVCLKYIKPDDFARINWWAYAALMTLAVAVLAAMQRIMSRPSDRERQQMAYELRRREEEAQQLAESRMSASELAEHRRKQRERSEQLDREIEANARKLNAYAELERRAREQNEEEE